MSTYLRKFNNLAAYEAEKQAETLQCPNVSLIADSGEVKYLRQNPPIGIGIRALVNGVKYYYTLEEWNALETKPALANCNVYVKTEDTAFVLHGTLNNGAKWSDSTGVVVPDVTTTTVQAQALLDFRGKENTEAVLAALNSALIVNAPIFEWVNTLSIGSDSCFIPSAGQLELIRLNITAINGCRTALGQATLTIQGQYWWTSTQYSATLAWYWYSSQWIYYNKYITYKGVALSAF